MLLKVFSSFTNVLDDWLVCHGLILKCCIILRKHSPDQNMETGGEVNGKGEGEGWALLFCRGGNGELMPSSLQSTRFHWTPKYYFPPASQWAVNLRFYIQLHRAEITAPVLFGPSTTQKEMHSNSLFHFPRALTSNIPLISESKKRYSFSPFEKGKNPQTHLRYYSDWFFLITLSETTKIKQKNEMGVPFSHHIDILCKMIFLLLFRSN